MDKTTIDLIDKITELLGNSDGQSPEEIEKELSEDGVDVDKVKKELLEFRINTAIVAKNVYAERARCLKAVDDKPEWSPMSREYKRDVANAKKNIKKRIEEDK